MQVNNNSFVNQSTMSFGTPFRASSFATEKTSVPNQQSFKSSYNSSGSFFPTKESSLNDFTARYTQRNEEAASQKMQEIRNLLKDLKKQQLQQQQQLQQPGKQIFTGTLQEKMNDFLNLSGAPSDDNKLSMADNSYNGKQVENKIRSAKTSISAGQALLTAKRKVQQIKVKINTSSGDVEDLQVALIHAKRMEAVARKKKHHLELEELAKVTIERNEQKDKMEETVENIQSTMVQLSEEEIYAREDEIFEERLDFIDQLKEQTADGVFSEEFQNQMMKELSEFGEEMFKQLEELMSLMEEMEFINPNMTKEELEELKRKHRNQEEKAMVKANMDYLKEMVKRGLIGNKAPGTGNTQQVPIGIPAMSASMPATPVSVDGLSF